VGTHARNIRARAKYLRVADQDDIGVFERLGQRQKARRHLGTDSGRVARQ
jgi:hypothetical protein